MRAVEDRLVRESLGRMARQASAQYDIGRTVANMEALYEEVLREKGRA